MPDPDNVTGRERMIPVWSTDHVLALEQTIKTLRAERDELRERLRRSNEALDHLAGYAAPE